MTSLVRLSSTKLHLDAPNVIKSMLLFSVFLLLAVMLSLISPVAVLKLKLKTLGVSFTEVE